MLRSTLVCLFVLFCLVPVAYAGPDLMPPYDTLAYTEGGAKALRFYDSVKSVESIRHDGLDEPDFYDLPAVFVDALRPSLARRILSPLGWVDPAPVLEFKALTICIEFSDSSHVVPPSFYDSLIYGTSTTDWLKPLTVSDYYYKSSYHRMRVVAPDPPSDIEWVRIPMRYIDCVAGAHGLGGYPNNFQRAVELAVDVLKARGFDFRPYTNGGRQVALHVVHVRPGAEVSGSTNDVWSHKWGIVPKYVTTDGLYVGSYFCTPEFWYTPGDMTIGVGCHEFAHYLGVPDLYATNGSWNGTGRWSPMSNGSWNGGLGSQPALFDAWCRTKLGFGTVVSIERGVGRDTLYLFSNEISDTIYRYALSVESGYLFEVKGERGLPSAESKLFLWRYDQSSRSRGGNNYPWYPPSNMGVNNPLLTPIQWDNGWHLERRVNMGDAGDGAPWGVASYLSDTSHPSLQFYTGEASGLTVVSVKQLPGSVFEVVYSTCDCTWQGDMDANGTIDRTDYGIAWGVAFENEVDVRDPSCPYSRADVNASGHVDILDLFEVRNRWRRISDRWQILQCGGR